MLLVDGDTRSLRVLEVSLRKGGFTVTPAHSVQDALDKLELHAPDLIISETTFPDGDGFDLRRKVRATADWADIPFVFLTASAAIENKIRGLELGVDDYLTKPIYIKEIVTRINILLQKRQRARFEERRDGRTRFAGRVADMPVVDVIQTIEISRKSGVIQFTGDGGRQGAIYFRDGKVIDAEADALQGEDAVYRLLTWSDGEFEVVFRTVRRRDAITTSSQGLLMEGMRRLDEWTRLLEQLPPLTHRFEVDTAELVTRLGEVPDDNNLILRLIDGKRTLNEVIDACEFGDLECLQAISRLFFEGLLLDLDHGAPVKRNTGQPMPLVAIEDAFQSLPDAELGERIEEPPPAPAPPPEPEPPAQGEQVEQALDDIDDEPSAHALMGGYRPSSLRLIDEAVAAAQLIEPSLFDGHEAPGALETARREAAARIRAQRESDTAAPPAHVRDDDDAEISVEPADASGDDSVPRPIASEPAPEPRPDRTFELEDPTPRPSTLSPRAMLAGRREDSGLHMIGSLGRDRAEASGELVAPGSDPGIALPPSMSATQRELVTILPRRITREVPVLAPVPPRLPPADDEPFDDDGRAELIEALIESPRAEPPPPSSGPPSTAPVESPDDRELARPATEPGSTGGPSLMTLGLLALALVLAGMAIYFRFHRHPPPPMAPVQQMTVVPITPDDPADAGIADAPADAPVPSDDAAVGTSPPADAAVARPVVPPAHAPPPPGDLRKARALMDQAGDAIKLEKYDDAISLADQSLRLHRTARTYLLKATALQSLARLDEAIVAAQEAVSVANTYAPAHAALGRLLWAAHRYDEARPSLQRALDIDPTLKDAPALKRMLSEPR